MLICEHEMYPPPIEHSDTEPYYTRMQIYPGQTSPLNEPNATEPYYTW